MQTSLCVHALLVSLCVSKHPLLIRTAIRLDWGPPYWPHFNLPLERTYLQIRSHSEVRACTRASLLCHVRLFAIPWTVAARFICIWDFPGKNIGIGCHFLLQGIFLTQGSNLCLLNCRQILYPLSHQGSPWGSAGINFNTWIWGTKFNLKQPGAKKSLNKCWYYLSNLFGRKCKSNAAGFSFIDQRGNCSSQLKSRLCRVCKDSWKLSSALQGDGCSFIPDGRTRVISWWSGGGGTVTEPQMVSLAMKTSPPWRQRRVRGEAYTERSTSRRDSLPAKPQRTPLPFSLGGERTGL